MERYVQQRQLRPRQDAGIARTLRALPNRHLDASLRLPADTLIEQLDRSLSTIPTPLMNLSTSTW